MGLNLPSAWAVLLLFFANALLVRGFEQNPFEPVADPSAQVTFPRARFTLLTSALVRLEYSSTGLFEDRPTWAVLNRLTPLPTFKVTQSQDWTLISTSDLVIAYNPSIVGEFTNNSLQIRLLAPIKNRTVTWVPGMPNHGNLLGTIKSLDVIETISLNCSLLTNVTPKNESLHCAWGLVSRDGWNILDDTGGPYLDTNEWPMDTPSNDDQDWYFFGHGHDYKRALRDYRLIGLPSPMVPKYIHGVMWSRWWSFTSLDTQRVLRQYQSRDLPLDTYIIDMDWHISEPIGQDMTTYWTGYTWDPILFPFPETEIGFLKTNGLHVSLNLHDSQGVRNWEKYYAPMATANGIDPSSGIAVPFNVTDEHYMFTLHDIVLLPLIQETGVDFWWIDWQQGGSTGVYLKNPLISPTFLLNQYRATWNTRLSQSGSSRKKLERGLILARWGAMGNHRYQVGFSGDVEHSWASLAFQPYFTFTATNVAYGLWSHDLHGQGLDYEMQTRWIQWGVVSPLFRPHEGGASGGLCADSPNQTCSLGTCTPIQIWDTPNSFYELNRLAVRLRAALLPLFYTLNREYYDTGLAPLRPLYYEWPELDVAYNVTTEYYLGNSIIAAPVVVPASPLTNMATTSIWLPQGTWVNRESGAIYAVTSPLGLTQSFQWDLSEIPLFVKAGSVIPMVPEAYVSGFGNANKQYNALSWVIYPGAPSGFGKAYDDDGISMDYQNGLYAYYTCSYKRSPNALKVSLGVNGSFPGRTSSRAYELRLVNGFPPKLVKLNGQPVPFSVYPKVGAWSFDPFELHVTLMTPALTDYVSIEFGGYDGISSHYFTNGLRGAVKLATIAKSLLDDVRIARENYANISIATQFGHRLNVQALNPTYVQSEYANFVPNFKAALAQAEAIKVANPSRKANVLALLNSALGDL